MNPTEADSNSGQPLNVLQAARLNKLRKIEELGIDPWVAIFPIDP